MGVICCEVPPKLAHEDAESGRQQDPSLSSIAGTTVRTSAATHPADHPENGNLQAPKFPSSAHEAHDMTSTKTKKKTVRINDEVTQIPLLTSSSFFRKTPKPITITNTRFGIMPSFRIVTPDAISSESSDSIEGSSDSEDDLVPKASLWWTKEERKQIQQANQKASRDFKRFQPTKIRRANLIYNDIVMDCCYQYDSQQDEENYDDNDIYDFFQRKRLNGRIESDSDTTVTTSSATTSPSSNKKRKREEFSTALIANSDLPTPTIPDDTIDLPTNVRGLEWAVMPDSKRYRKNHARTVLRWQDRLRRMNNRHHHSDDDCYEDLSSSSSSDDDYETYSDSNYKKSGQTRYHQHELDLLLGHKARISSLRSCIMAQVFGKSDEIAANPAISAASNLEKNRLSSSSPTPSLTGTTDDSESNRSDESESDEGSDSESDSDSEDEENERARPFKNFSSHRGGYYSTSTSLSVNQNSHRRMFRPRMMPPMSWR